MKITMKRKIQRTALTACVAVLVIGCKDNSVSSTEATGTAPESKAMTADADNSAKNVRDRDDATLTAGDQGNTVADRDTTQKIHKALVIDASGYSATAKNIKIITADGKVTLRGPVKTEAEKSGIVTLAKGIAGDGNVEDQLEVKANP
jgi:osmotically-inducible protein OsmY